jgi:hypothetical protein
MQADRPLSVIDRDGLLDQTRLAEQLVVTTKCLEAWRHRGGGPKFVKVGRLIRYRPSDVAEWLMRRTATSTSEKVR